ncbi:MAG: sulfotransferase family protein [Deltaproteobacteria bacterium]|jgi:hypothetical protein
MDHVFLSGNQRSGKTLLQLILASHPDISISPGTNIIAKVLFEMPRNRPLSPENLRTMRQVLQKDRKFKAWRIDHRAYQAHIARYRDVTTAQVVEDLMAFFRDQTKPGARYVGNKKGGYCKDGDLVKRVFPRAKLVFMLRDARGAVSSMLETQPEHDLVSASLMWWMKARRIRELKRELPDDVFVCRYEELVTAPEATARSICAFLGLPYAPEMLDRYRTNDAIRHRTDTTHHETYEAITTSMIAEWRDKLRTEQIEAIEGLLGSELEKSGYTPVARPARGLALARHRATRAREYLRWRAVWEMKRLRMG